MNDALLLLGLVEVQAKHPARAVPVLERALGLATKDGDPVERAQLQYLLAEALFDSRQDRVRAIALAREARVIFAADSGQAENAAEVDSWLARHAR